MDYSRNADIVSPHPTKWRGPQYPWAQRQRARTLHLGPANYCWLSKILDNQHYLDQGYAELPSRLGELLIGGAYQLRLCST
jgi:hypothetical protein